MAHAHLSDPETWIKTPKQLAAVVLVSFIVTVFGIILLVQFITGGLNVDADSPAMTEEAIAARLKPVGDVVLAQADTQPGTRSAEDVYKLACAACHDAGLLNSPKTGDAGAWKSRIAQGQKTLVTNAIHGIRQMPARGGNSTLTDAEVERAVVYMANKSGGTLKAPKTSDKASAPAQAAPRPATAAPAAAAVPPAAPAQTAAAPARADNVGEKVYNAACSMCHAQGLAGAPKTGDKSAWKARIAQGMDTLYTSALKGKNTMPPKGGAMSLPDADIKAAVDFLVAKSK